MGQSLSPHGGSLPPRKRIGSALANSRPSQSLSRSQRTPPPLSPVALNHAEIISSPSVLRDKGVALQSYKELLSSYEELSGSSYEEGAVYLRL
ncbi:hypothetical protein LIER_08716 [Lithospermum erythrorhizon]|uniref:Uncharacterized protein n=1 Tax=Lithospermum erythrorhizon TaxID=34254 RepID=A0AAV3PF30_LITER